MEAAAAAFLVSADADLLLEPDLAVERADLSLGLGSVILLLIISSPRPPENKMWTELRGPT